jgi:hypothetical protein
MLFDEGERQKGSRISQAERQRRKESQSERERERQQRLEPEEPQIDFSPCAIQLCVIPVLFQGDIT